MANIKENRVAIYSRVSTRDQDTGLQLDELRSIARQRGMEVVAEFVDEGYSGTRDSRPALDDLMAAAHRGEFGTVLVWKFDRFARSVSHLVRALETFRSLGIDFISVREQIDTGTAMGRMVYHVIASISEFEAELIRERVVAGLKQAKRKGVKLGRPKRDDLDLKRVRRLLESGNSLADVARLLDIPRTTIKSALDRDDEKPRRENGHGCSISA